MDLLIDGIEVIRGEGGALAVVLVGLWLFLTGRIRRAAEVEDMKQQRDEWRSAYWDLQRVAENSVDVAERAVGHEVR